MKTFVFGLVVIAALVQVGEAQDRPDRPFRLYGPVVNNTVVSCGAFRSAPDATRALYEWWALGFISGAGSVYAHQDLAFGQTDPAGITSWIDKYCGDHPTDPLVKPALELVKELQRRATTR